MFYFDLRFPLHPTIIEILQFYNICPVQLTHNAWRDIIGFIIVETSVPISVNVAVFASIYRIQQHFDAKSLWYFVSWSKTKPLIDTSTKTKGWKSRFFYVYYECPWCFPFAWNFDDYLPSKSKLTKDDEQAKLAIII